MCKSKDKYILIILGTSISICCPHITPPIIVLWVIKKKWEKYHTQNPARVYNVRQSHLNDLKILSSVSSMSFKFNSFPCATSHYHHCLVFRRIESFTIVQNVNRWNIALKSTQKIGYNVFLAFKIFHLDIKSIYLNAPSSHGAIGWKFSSK